MLYEDNLCFIEPLTDDDYNYLAHYGKKGMHWRQRLYQNLDGTWTELGKMRRRVGGAASASKDIAKKVAKKTGKVVKASAKSAKKAVKRAVEKSKERKVKKALKKEEKLQRDIKRAIARNKVDDIIKLAGNMTTEQLLDAANRSSYLKRLRDNAPPKKKTIRQQVAEKLATEVVKTGGALANKAMSNLASTSKSEGKSAFGTIMNELKKGVADSKAQTKSNTSKSEPSRWDRQEERTNNYQTNDYWKEYRQKRAEKQNKQTAKDYKTRYDDFVNNFSREEVSEYAKTHHGSFAGNTSSKKKKKHK